MDIELLTFDKSHNLHYNGEGRINFKKADQILIIELENKDDIFIPFHRQFIQVKTLLCIVAPKQTNDIILILSSETLCKEIHDSIFECRIYNAPENSQQLFKDRFLSSLLDGIHGCNENVNNRLKTIIKDLISLPGSFSRETTEIPNFSKEQQQQQKVENEILIKMPLNDDNNQSSLSRSSYLNNIPPIEQHQQQQGRFSRNNNENVMPVDMNYPSSLAYLMSDPCEEQQNYMSQTPTETNYPRFQGDESDSETIIEDESTNSTPQPKRRRLSIHQSAVATPERPPIVVQQRPEFESQENTGFKLLQFYSNSLNNARLSIFATPDKNLCYEFSFDQTAKRFFCERCRKLRHRVYANLIIQQNGNKSVELSNIAHICEPTIYRPYFIETKMIKADGFKLMENDSKKLIIFERNAKNYCRVLLQKKNEETEYVCRKCQTRGLKVFALMFKHSDGERYLQLGPNDHVCNAELRSKVEPKESVLKSPSPSCRNVTQMNFHFPSSNSNQIPSTSSTFDPHGEFNFNRNVFGFSGESSAQIHPSSTSFPMSNYMSTFEPNSLLPMFIPPNMNHHQAQNFGMSSSTSLFQDSQNYEIPQSLKPRPPQPTQLANAPKVVNFDFPRDQSLSSNGLTVPQKVSSNPVAKNLPTIEELIQMSANMFLPRRESPPSSLSHSSSKPNQKTFGIPINDDFFDDITPKTLRSTINQIISNPEAFLYHEGSDDIQPSSSSIFDYNESEPGPSKSSYRQNIAAPVYAGASNSQLQSFQCEPSSGPSGTSSSHRLQNASNASNNNSTNNQYDYFESEPGPSKVALENPKTTVVNSQITRNQFYYHETTDHGPSRVSNNRAPHAATPFEQLQTSENQYNFDHESCSPGPSRGSYHHNPQNASSIALEQSISHYNNRENGSNPSHSSSHYLQNSTIGVSNSLYQYDKSTAGPSRISTHNPQNRSMAGQTTTFPNHETSQPPSSPLPLDDNIVPMTRFEIHVKTKNGNPRYYLHLFDNFAKHFSYTYAFDSQRKQFLCQQCRIKGQNIYATLMKKDSNEFYIYMGLGSHQCSSMLYIPNPDIDSKVDIRDFYGFLGNFYTDKRQQPKQNPPTKKIDFNPMNLFAPESDD